MAEMAGVWTEEQNDAIVADYFAMLADDIAGRPYSKAEHNRLLQAVIGRPRGSIEYKHRNISAVLKGLGEDWLPGYKPAFNFQASLVNAVARWLDRHPDWLARIAMGPSPLALREEAMLWIGPPPTHCNAPPPNELEQMTAIARKFDVAERDARNRALGRAGEERILAHERATLLAAGRTISPRVPDRLERTLLCIEGMVAEHGVGLNAQKQAAPGRNSSSPRSALYECALAPSDGRTVAKFCLQLTLRPNVRLSWDFADVSERDGAGRYQPPQNSLWWRQAKSLGDHGGVGLYPIATLQMLVQLVAVATMEVLHPRRHFTRGPGGAEPFAFDDYPNRPVGADRQHVNLTELLARSETRHRDRLVRCPTSLGENLRDLAFKCAAAAGDLGVDIGLGYGGTQFGLSEIPISSSSMAYSVPIRTWRTLNMISGSSSSLSTRSGRVMSDNLRSKNHGKMSARSPEAACPTQAA